MTQAFTRGVIDFTCADPLDPLWWKRLMVALDQLDSDNFATSCRLDFEEAMTLLAHGNLEANSFSRALNRANSFKTHIKQTLFPWITFDRRAALQQDIDALNAVWTREWGAPGSPETQAKIAATVKALNAANKALKKG